VHTGKGGSVGKVSFQSVLPDGRWLDDIVGQRFSLVIDSSNTEPLQPSIGQTLDELGVVVIRDGGSRAQQWFAENQMSAILVRPDKYVFDAIEKLSDLPSSLCTLNQWIKP
jgi:3-(3-hydroxy-phenyl)propionate hydroxylase